MNDATAIFLGAASILGGQVARVGTENVSPEKAIKLAFQLWEDVMVEIHTRNKEAAKPKKRGPKAKAK